MSQRSRRAALDEVSLPGPKESILEQAEWQGGQLYYADLQYVMSHHHFRVDFCPHMNFLIGPNGAGKSATLIAIALCLGAKATITNRLKKFADAITAGHNTATIRVGIVNIGEDAWRPKDYGTVITVERKLRREGSSSVKLYGGVPRKEKDEQGDNEKNNAGLVNVELLPGRSATEELRTILDRFRIQPNNPCTILMQEKAREFLVSSNPKQLYKFWHDATLLTQINTDLEQVASNQQSTELKKTSKQKQLPAMSSKLAEYKQEFEEMQQRQNLARKIRELQVQIVWASVAAVEREVDQSKRIMASAAESIEKWEKKLIAIRERDNADSKRAQEVRVSVDAAQEEARRSEAAKRATEEEFRIKRRDVSAVEARIEHKADESEALKKRLTRLDKEIADATSSGAARALVQKLQREKDALQAEKSEAEGKRKELESGVAEAQSRVDKAREEEEDAKLAAANAERKLNTVTKRLHDIQRSGRPAAARSGKGDEIRELIEKNERRFKRVPLGPMSALVTAKEEKYTDAVESAIRISLQRFLVDNQEDDRTLRRLCTENKLPIPPTTVQRFSDTVYNTKPNEPPADQLTILRVVKSEHPQVLNHLIDQFSIENTLVCDNVEEATEKLFRGRVANAKSAFTLSGQQLRLVRGTTETNMNRYQAKTIVSDVEGARRHAEANLAAAEVDERESNARLGEAQRMRERAAKTLQAMRQDINKEESLVNRLNLKLTEVSRKLEDAETELNVDVDELRRNRAELAKQKEQLEADMHALRKELEETKQRMAPFELKAKEARSAVERLGRDAEQYAKELSDIVGRLAKIDAEKAQAENNLSQLRAKRTEAELAVTNKTAEIAELSRKASGVGERPAELPASSVADLQRDLEQKTQRAKKEAEGKRSPDEIVKQYEEAAAKFASTEEALNSLNLIAEKLAVMYNARVQHYKALRKIYSTRTSLLFMDYISQRGYGGALAYDHAEQRLTLDVDVDASQAAEARRSVFSLSGGERMFSTVAFLLSLWMTIEAPFYALDEFDVFMDALHRTQSLRLLSDHAREKAKNRQFIFISPQSEAGMPKGNDVRSFRLHPPMRGGAQGTLDNVLVASSQQ